MSGLVVLKKPLYRLQSIQTFSFDRRFWLIDTTIYDKFTSTIWRQSMRHVIRVVLALGIFSSAVLSQTNRGQLVGTVTDAAGASIPRAAVSAVNPETSVKFEGVSNEAGQFQIYLPFGRYEVHV